MSLRDEQAAEQELEYWERKARNARDEMQELDEQPWTTNGQKRYNDLQVTLEEAESQINIINQFISY